jgi:hypothetical protein
VEYSVTSAASWGRYSAVLNGVDWLLLAACDIIPERFVRANSILRANLSSMMPLATATTEPVMNDP